MTVAKALFGQWSVVLFLVVLCIVVIGQSPHGDNNYFYPVSSGVCPDIKQRMMWISKRMVRASEGVVGTQRQLENLRNDGKRLKGYESAPEEMARA